MAIGAYEIREGDIIVGDAISPKRFGAGVPVRAVNHDIDDTVLVLAGGRELEYVARSHDLRPSLVPVQQVAPAEHSLATSSAGV